MTTTTTPDVKATAAKNGRYVETSEYAKAAARFVKALGRRVGDEMDIEALPYLDALARELDAILVESARKLNTGQAEVPAAGDEPARRAVPGYSFKEIGDVLDVTQQTAHRRFGPKRQDPRTAKARSQEHGRKVAEARRAIREAMDADDNETTEV
jgi:hypothetical protein